MSGMILNSKCLEARTWKAAFLVAIAPLLAHAAEPKGAEPATRAANAAVLNQLPFNDRSAFDDARRGFVAAPPDLVIRTDGDRVAWTMSAFDFLNKDQAPATVNPSLWRQAQLNAIWLLL